MAQTLITFTVPVTDMYERTLQQQAMFQGSTNNCYDTAISIPRDSTGYDPETSPPTYEQIAAPPSAYADIRMNPSEPVMHYL